METYGIEDAGRLARVVSGEVDPARLTLFSTMKNEMGFLPAWLAHHRGIGFEQFLIWDDSSDDGSFDYLRAQPDVVVMRSEGLGFGSLLKFRDPEGESREERLGTYMKIALPHLFFDGAYVSYVDADEFLILPPGVGSVAEVIARLKGVGAPSAVASVVEFFPAAASGLAGPLPQSFEGLIAAYPYYQCEKLVALREGAQPDLIGKAKTARLFSRFEIEPKVVRRGWQKVWMSSREKKAQQFQKSPRHKTPIVLRSAQSRLTGSHFGNLPPSSDILLTVAHFVFTAQFADKIARATAWGAHANAAAKYRYYAELLERMDGVENGFLDDNSVAYDGPEGLIDCGLMRW
ncbi:glycosyltransferase family 2 protein [Mameliella alba]|nr:glycosyltransferase family 2 protein [Mameliella alba]MBY6169698.1 glycosyltransferase family 2 protein [Mameliella alba]MBY6174717.1 glycosyltransferase family 2 protein [Mameliella alba]